MAHQYTSYTTQPASYTAYDVRTSGVHESPLRQSAHGAGDLAYTTPTSYANFTAPSSYTTAPAGYTSYTAGGLGGSYTQVTTSNYAAPTSNYAAPSGYTIPSTIPQSYTSGASTAGAYTAPTSYTAAHTTTYTPATTTYTPATTTYTPVDVSHHHHTGETVKQSRQVQSLPAPNQPRQSVLSPYRHSMYPEFEMVEDLPDRSNLLSSLNTLLLKSPARESLLTAPCEVQIKRESVLSPAQILVQSLLKEKYEDGTVYEGEARGGKSHGRGRLTFKDGRVFEGEFQDGRAQGKGVFFYKNGSVCYEGEIANNVFDGKGVLRNENPTPVQGPIDVKNFGNLANNWTRYEGEFKNGKRHGNGVLYLSNGDKFTGEFKNDKVDGKGTLEQRDGRVLQGKWDDNVLKQ